MKITASSCTRSNTQPYPDPLPLQTGARPAPHPVHPYPPAHRYPHANTILEVETDEASPAAIAPTSINKYQLDILKTHAIGESPFARERLFQMLHKGTRWVYRTRLVRRVRQLSLGHRRQDRRSARLRPDRRVRQRLPVYLTAPDMELQGYLNHIEGGRTFGVNAYSCTPSKAARPTSLCSPTFAKRLAMTMACSTIPSAHTTCAKPSRWAGPWKNSTTSGSKSRCTSRK